MKKKWPGLECKYAVIHNFFGIVISLIITTIMINRSGYGLSEKFALDGGFWSLGILQFSALLSLIMCLWYCFHRGKSFIDRKTKILTHTIRVSLKHSPVSIKN